MPIWKRCCGRTQGLIAAAVVGPAVVEGAEEAQGADRSEAGQAARPRGALAGFVAPRRKEQDESKILFANSDTWSAFWKGMRCCLGKWPSLCIFDSIACCGLVMNVPTYRRGKGDETLARIVIPFSGTMAWVAQQCIPLRELGQPELKAAVEEEMARRLGDGWRVHKGYILTRSTG